LEIGAISSLYSLISVLSKDLVNPESAFDRFPVMETARLRLRAVRPGDVTAVFTLFSDPTVTRYYGMDPYKTVDQAAQRVSAIRQNYLKRRGIRWAITRQGDDTLIGTVGLMNWKPKFFSAALGYELAPAYWGQGMMTEALTAVLSYSFTLMALNRLEAYVVPQNAPSIALLQKLGFVNEGLMREYGYWGQTFHDLYLFALLKREWGEIGV
jgi:[ribosomal protein S5]-alanine N-acetyltransferase